MSLKYYILVKEDIVSPTQKCTQIINAYGDYAPRCRRNDTVIVSPKSYVTTVSR